MNLKLIGKTALVTGSTAGIGLAIAESLVAEGANVVLNGRSRERVEGAVQTVKAGVENARVSGVFADLSTPEGAQKIIEGIPEVDILVNNMGIFEIKAFEEIGDDDWLRIFEANVMSGVRLSRHYLPKMKAKNWGRIVFISSESGINIPVEMVHYGMTKAAQLAISRGIAETTAGTNVTVNAVLPGPTASEGGGAFVAQMAEEQGITKEEAEKQFFKTARPTSLIQRFSEPKEIGDFVTFVCSPLASSINGAALRVDGGVFKSMV
ncbi:MAG TPA: SDR family NAD(P)-dependent oxidoreductase [Pyrinomonadaceae bacterium]|nr:SDR family NAD(P)-dependent oxidoreductase [Pyrinomonadaceae bacterium]